VKLIDRWYLAVTMICCLDELVSLAYALIGEVEMLVEPMVEVLSQSVTGSLVVRSGCSLEATVVGLSR